jgi:hypothetical protein
VIVMLDTAGITTTTLALGLVFLNVPEGFSGSGEYLYVPDMNSLRVAAYTDVSSSHPHPFLPPANKSLNPSVWQDTAMLFGFFEHKSPVPHGLPSIKDGTPGYGSAMCPRGLLKRICECVILSSIILLAPLGVYISSAIIT